VSVESLTFSRSISGVWDMLSSGISVGSFQELVGGGFLASFMSGRSYRSDSVRLSDFLDELIELFDGAEKDR